MKFLLDTHIWLWTLLEPKRLKKNTKEILKNIDNTFYISPITIWETLILAEKNRIKLNPSPEKWVFEALKKSPVEEAELTHSIAIKSTMIKLPHKDPADRFIAATAWEYDMTLITEDEILKKATQIKVL